MSDKQLLTKKVQDFFQREQLIMEIDPSDSKMVDWYAKECLQKLPNLYRELEEAKMLPENPSWDSFKQVFFELEQQQIKGLLGQVRGR